MENTNVIGARFPEALPITLVESLLEIASVIFSVKDERRRYVGANKAMLGLCSARGADELIGRHASDFFSAAAADRYELADKRVMRTVRPIQNQLDLTIPLRAPPLWALQQRWPVIDGRGRVLGVAVLARALAPPDPRYPTYGRIAAAVEHIQTHFGASIDIADLAQRTGVSISQLERDFIAVFGMSPRRYLAKVRLDMALEMLLTEAPLAEIAQACGYTDQSAFAHRFRAVIGMSPSQYRRERLGKADKSGGA